jgi:hypothetical protein
VAVRWRFQAVGRLETLPKTDVDQNFSNAAGVYKERGSQTGSKNLLGADLFSRTFCKEIVMSRSIRYALAVSLVSLFTACGGGGGSVSPTTSTVQDPSTFPTLPTLPAPDTFALKTAWASIFTDSSTLNFTASGVISGVTISGSGKATQSVPSSATFESLAGLKKTVVTTGTVTGTLNGTVVTLPLEGTSTIYVDTNYLPLGETGDYYWVVTPPVTIPPFVKIGDTGWLYKETVYSSSAKTTPLATIDVSYAVNADTVVGPDALLKLVGTEKNTSGAVASVTTITFRMTAAGGITRLSEVSVSGADTLTITYSK